MRQCVFVIGTGGQLRAIAPTLQQATRARLRHTVWFTGQQREPIADLAKELDLSSRFVMPDKSRARFGFGNVLVWLPLTLYRCFHYVSGVRTWTTKRPLVIVQGDALSTWLGAVAGHWGGGDVVQLDSGMSSGKWSDPFPQELLRRLTHRNVRYAFCPDEAAAARMRRYPRCIVEVAAPVIDRLLRLSGGGETKEVSEQAANG